MQPKLIGVVGLGLMGRGIAACFVCRGFDVIGYDLRSPALTEAHEHVRICLGDLAGTEQWQPARFTATADLHALAQCDIIIESVTEDLDIKRRVFDELEPLLAPHVPIASNTSCLPITLLQSGRLHPNRFIGAHFLEPCHLTRFLELIRGDLTDDATMQTMLDIAHAAGKEPSVLNRDIDGFVANRLLYAMLREAFFLLETNVADAASIDCAFRNSIGLWGRVAGPFRWMEMTGLESYRAVMARLLPKLSASTAVPQSLQEPTHAFYPATDSAKEMWRQRLRDAALSALKDPPPCD